MDRKAKENLPARTLPDDMVDRAAIEIAAQLALHIVTMYPKAAQAVAWGSCKRSMSGVVRNNMNRLSRSAENGTFDAELKKMRGERVRLSKMYKRTNFASPDWQEETEAD